MLLRINANDRKEVTSIMQAVPNFPQTLPTPRHKFKPRANVKSMDTIKYFNTMQIKLIRKTVKNKALLDIKKGQVTGIREWLVFDIITLTGIRVSEAANLRCGDIKTGYGQSELFIRNGKGSKSRTIQIPKSLKNHLTPIFALPKNGLKLSFIRIRAIMSKPLICKNILAFPHKIRFRNILYYMTFIYEDNKT